MTILEYYRRQTYEYQKWLSKRINWGEAIKQQLEYYGCKNIEEVLND